MQLLLGVQEREWALVA